MSARVSSISKEDVSRSPLLQSQKPFAEKPQKYGALTKETLLAEHLTLN